MTLSRVLPATPAPRFARASRAVCTAQDASFEVVVAEGFALRVRGLAGLDAPAIVPLLFPRCRSLHTFGMRVPIDVAWLSLDANGETEVLAVEESLPRRRTSRAPRERGRGHTAALELAAGDALTLGLRGGSRVVISGER